MKTHEQVERESRSNLGRYCEYTNSYEVLEFDEETVECAVCGNCFPPEEIREADLFGDGKKYLLCDKHYEIHLEENEDDTNTDADFARLDAATEQMYKMIDKINKAS